MAISEVKNLQRSYRDILSGTATVNAAIAYIESSKLKILESQASLKADVAVVTSRLDDSTADSEGARATKETRRRNKGSDKRRRLLN